MEQLNLKPGTRKRVKELRAQGVRVAEIAKIMQDEGYKTKTGKPFSPAYVSLLTPKAPKKKQPTKAQGRGQKTERIPVIKRDTLKPVLADFVKVVESNQWSFDVYSKLESTYKRAVEVLNA